MIHKIRNYLTSGIESIGTFFIYLNILTSFFTLLQSDTGKKDTAYYVYQTETVLVSLQILLLIFLIVLAFTLMLLRTERFRDYQLVRYGFLAGVAGFVFTQGYMMFYSPTVIPGEEARFPFMSFLLLTLTIWKIGYSENEKKDLTIKVVTTLLMYTLMSFAYQWVVEAWYYRD
jgi:hypothetical protein